MAYVHSGPVTGLSWGRGARTLHTSSFVDGGAYVLTNYSGCVGYDSALAAAAPPSEAEEVAAADRQRRLEAVYRAAAAAAAATAPAAAAAAVPYAVGPVTSVAARVLAEAEAEAAGGSSSGSGSPGQSSKANASTAAARATLLQEVAAFRAQLSALLTANDSAHPLERLERAEFTLDAHRAAAIEAEFDAHVAARRAAYAAEGAALDSQYSALKGAVWEAYSTAPALLRPIAAGAAAALAAAAAGGGWRQRGGGRRGGWRGGGAAAPASAQLPCAQAQRAREGSDGQAGCAAGSGVRGHARGP